MIAQKEFIENYDKAIFDPHKKALYNDSGYYNVGYWARGNNDLQKACESMVDKHVDWLKKDESEILLDVGCGLGATTARIAGKRKNASVYGINISTHQLKLAREEFKGKCFVVSDAAQLGIKSGSVFSVISIEAIFHFHSRIKFLAEAYRVLKPGGRLIFTDILFKDSSLIGQWSVPACNLGLHGSDYGEICREAGFFEIYAEDITSKSWDPFCDLLGNFTKNPVFGERLKSSIYEYRFSVLEKPN